MIQISLGLRPGPGLQDIPLRLALLLARLLEVVAEWRGFERSVAWVAKHDPLAAPSFLAFLERLESIGLARAVSVVEIAELVADVQRDAVVLGNDGTARALLAAPVGLFILQHEGVDVAAHRETKLLHVLPGVGLGLAAAIGNVKHLDAL